MCTQTKRRFLIWRFINREKKLNFLFWYFRRYLFVLCRQACIISSLIFLLSVHFFVIVRFIKKHLICWRLPLKLMPMRKSWWPWFEERTFRGVHRSHFNEFVVSAFDLYEIGWLYLWNSRFSSQQTATLFHIVHISFWFASCRLFFAFIFDVCTTHDVLTKKSRNFSCLWHSKPISFEPIESESSDERLCEWHWVH